MTGALWWVLMCAAFYGGIRMERAWARARATLYEPVPDEDEPVSYLVTCKCARCMDWQYRDRRR
jgi:hypothetical protein